MAFLIWNTAEGTQTHRLEGGARIGRSADNDVTLGDPRVSSFHARVSGRDGRWVFEDLGSTNGSLINGERQNRAGLRDGDVIRLGHAELTFRATLGAAATAEGPRSSTTFAGPGYMTRIEDIFADGPAIAPVSSLAAAAERPLQEESAEDPSMLGRRLTASYEISKATAATLDLSEVLDRVLSALFEIFATAERALILLVDADTNSVSAAAVRRRLEDRGEPIPISHTALRQAIEERRAILCTDAMRDQRYANAQSIVTLGIRSLMIAPLVFQDRVLGAIYVDTRSAADQFTESDLRLLSAAGAQVGACVANVLLHERVVAGERLAAVGQTVAGLTHCIKNILQGIRGGAFIVDKALRDGKTDKLKTGWEIMQRNNSFMEELVFDLLSLSKQRSPEYETADLNTLCGEVCELVSARAKAADVALNFAPDAGLQPVMLDPKGLRRCVLNLVTNAVDACRDGGGTVSVRTAADGADGHVRIMVEDSGCGMSRETREKLFAVFFSTKGSKGTGLGLPVTRKIIEEHNGRIEVDSEQGKGTTFTICLPCGEAPTEVKGARGDG